MSREPIVVERELGADAETVFAAWGDAASLRSWMRPATEICDCEVEVDFRVGGRFRIVMRGDRDYAHHGEYLEIEPPKRIVMTWVSEWLPAGSERTLVRIDLEPIGPRRTRLVLTHFDLPDSPAYEGHVAGWARILELLGERLAGTAAPVRESDPIRPGAVS